MPNVVHILPEMISFWHIHGGKGAKYRIILHVRRNPQRVCMFISNCKIPPASETQGSHCSQYLCGSHYQPLPQHVLREVGAKSAVKSTERSRKNSLRAVNRPSSPLRGSLSSKLQGIFSKNEKKNTLLIAITMAAKGLSGRTVF